MKITDTEAHTLQVLISGLNAWGHTEEGQDHVDALIRHTEGMFGPLELDVIARPTEVLTLPEGAAVTGADNETYTHERNDGKGPVWIMGRTGDEVDAFELPLPATVQR